MFNSFTKLFKLSIITAMLITQQHSAIAAEPTYGKVPINNVNINAINDCIAHHKKGIVFLESGYPLHAIDEFKLAIMLNPNSTMSATVYNNLGRAYEMIRSYDLAIASYQHAIKINPNFSLYYKNIVNAYRAKRTTKQALLDYEKIVELNPQDAQAYFILGLLYLEIDDKSKALESFKKVTAIEPGIDLSLAAKKYIQQLTPASKK